MAGCDKEVQEEVQFWRFGVLEISWQFHTCLGGLLSFVCLLESFLVMGGMPHLTGVGVIKGSV